MYHMQPHENRVRCTLTVCVSTAAIEIGPCIHCLASGVRSATSNLALLIINSTLQSSDRTATFYLHEPSSLLILLIIIVLKPADGRRETRRNAGRGRVRGGDGAAKNFAPAIAQVHVFHRVAVNRIHCTVQSQAPAKPSTSGSSPTIRFVASRLFDEYGSILPNIPSSILRPCYLLFSSSSSFSSCLLSLLLPLAHYLASQDLSPKHVLRARSPLLLIKDRNTLRIHRPVSSFPTACLTT